MQYVASEYAQYEADIDKVISLLEKDTNDDALLGKIQNKLDALAHSYQDDEALGTGRYKLYQAQAMLHYRRNDDASAIQWMQEAMNVRGKSYEFAEEFMQAIARSRPRKPTDKWVVLIALPFVSLFMVALLQMVVHFVYSKAAQPSMQSIALTTMNILSLLVGMASIALILLIPVWVVMLVKARRYNGSMYVYGRSKTTAVVLAMMLGYWTWCYTYEHDKKKFWFSFALNLATLTLWGYVAWIWAVIDTVKRPNEYYLQYPSYDA